MTTDPVFAALLRLQELDTAADQLGHRRASLPEHTTLAEEQAAMAALDVELSELAQRSDELRRSQRRLEDEVASIEAKAADTDRKLYSGTVTVPKELQAMQTEVEGLRRRASALEDDILELMEAAEPVDAERSRLEERMEVHRAEAARLGALVAEQEAALDTELAAVVAEREEVVAGIDGPLLARYDDLRRRLGGVAVARLVGAQCDGCHLTLPATELDAVRHAPPGELVVHEECGRILVRGAPPA